jgi:GTP-binding protein
LRARLFDELRHNVALRVTETDNADTFTVSGRGELHLAILIETMRREGYEFQVSRPEVLLRQGKQGELLEPYEKVYIETSSDTIGVVVEMMGSRHGQMLDMVDTQENSVRLTYLAPTRGLLGFRYRFLTATRGMGVLHTLFHRYRHGRTAHLVPQIPALDRRDQISFERLFGCVGEGRHHFVRPAQRPGPGHAVR